MQIQHIYRQTDKQKSVFYAWFEAMHTRIDLAFCNLPESTACTLSMLIKDEISRIEGFADRFNPTSELSFINRQAAQEAVKVHPELYTIITDCKEYCQRTAGAFDITVQSVSHSQTDIHNLLCDPLEQTIRFARPGMLLDLCGYIKGYALDKIRNILESSPCTDALISLGNSSILAWGHHPNGQGWPIALPGQPGQSVTLSGACLTTSGNTDGHYHLINPQTGQKTTTTVPISVITRTGCTGEVLSTALSVCNDSQRAFIFKSFDKEFKLGLS